MANEGNADLKTAPRKGGRPPRAATHQIEEQIVDVARDLFFLHGYGATSVEIIAKRAGISKRTFYHRFPNKAAIFHTVVRNLIQRVMPADVNGLFEGRNCEDILQGLALAMLQASLAPHVLDLHRLVLAEATRFPELALVMNEQGSRRDAIVRIAAILERETREDRMTIKDPVLAAEMFMQMVVGLPQRKALGMGVAMTAKEREAWALSAVHIFLNGCQTH